MTRIKQQHPTQSHGCNCSLMQTRDSVPSAHTHQRMVDFDAIAYDRISLHLMSIHCAAAERGGLIK